MGGLTHYSGAGFSRKQNITVSLAGPGVGVALYILFQAAALVAVLPENTIFSGFIQMGMWVNFVWTLLNMMPVLPLDGGQVLRDVLGPRQARVTCIIGAVTGGILCLVGLLYGQIFAAVLFGFLAWQNWKGGQRLQGGTVRQ